jgi:hypothetical protein
MAKEGQKKGQSNRKRKLTIEDLVCEHCHGDQLYKKGDDIWCGQCEMLVNVVPRESS